MQSLQGETPDCAGRVQGCCREARTRYLGVCRAILEDDTPKRRGLRGYKYRIPIQL